MKKLILIPLLACLVLLAGCGKNEVISANVDKMFVDKITFEEQGIDLKQAASFIQTWNCGNYTSYEACENATYYYFTAKNTDSYEVKTTLDKMKLDDSVQLCTSNSDCSNNQRCITLCRYKDKYREIGEIVCAFDRVDNEYLFAYTNVGVCDEFKH